MQNITNCCYTIKQNSNIRIEPKFFDNNFLSNIKDILREKYENKCQKDGYVLKILDILSYNDNHIDFEDNPGDIIMNIVFTIQKCQPKINDKILIKIIKINNLLMVGENGPLKCILKGVNINKEVFSVIEQKIFIKSLDKNLEENDYVVFIIQNLKIYSQNKNIVIIGQIDNIYLDKQVENYMIN